MAPAEPNARHSGRIELIRRMDQNDAPRAHWSANVVANGQVARLTMTIGTRQLSLSCTTDLGANTTYSKWRLSKGGIICLAPIHRKDECGAVVWG